MSLADVSAHQDALSTLRSSWQLIEPGLRSALRTGCPPFETIAGYHFGWCDERGAPVRGNGGKAVRPALTLLMAQAVGARPEVALEPAIAVELVHNFSLVHDDVMDHDTQRRHRPTVWALFGVPSAILVGDAMLAVAQELVATSAHPAVRRTATALAAAVQHMMHGQFSDLDFETRAEVSLDECLAMASLKTGALLECACVLGAMSGGADKTTAAAARDFGRHLGVAFQCADDLLGIWGDPDRTGKPVWSDLRSRKKSLPVTAALTAGGVPGRRLAAIYRSRDALNDDQLAEAARLVENAGGRAWTEQAAQRNLDSALRCLKTIGADADTERKLSAIACLIVDRDK